jgi:hypothetical protein
MEYPVVICTPAAPSPCPLVLPVSPSQAPVMEEEEEHQNQQRIGLSGIFFHNYNLAK